MKAYLSEWQEQIQEALDDIREGRVYRTESAKEVIRRLNKVDDDS